MECCKTPKGDEVVMHSDDLGYSGNPARRLLATNIDVGFAGMSHRSLRMRSIRIIGSLVRATKPHLGPILSGTAELKRS